MPLTHVGFYVYENTTEKPNAYASVLWIEEEQVFYVEYGVQHPNGIVIERKVRVAPSMIGGFLAARGFVKVDLPPISAEEIMRNAAQRATY